MNQNSTPILDAIENFRNERPAFFRIPAHRFERGADPRALEVLGEKAFMSDLTEAEGLDDLHQPAGPIREAQDLAAEIWGSDHCWFLVNGTTCGNEAMILASVQPGEKILVPRTAHKSVLMGLILSGAVPVWVNTETVPGWNISGEVKPEEIEKALERDSEIRAVFVVSPTYYGICSDLRRIADICHRHGIPLLVDEAHGSHLYFSDQMPEGAIRAGADVAAQSIHKTSGSMTQSSMLQWKSRFVSRQRLDECLKLVMSTSPNYLLMGSLDGARHNLALHGGELMSKSMAMADILREELSRIPYVDVLTTDVCYEMSGEEKIALETARSAGIPLAELLGKGRNVPEHLTLDPLRIVFSARRAGITGYRLQRLLYDKGRVSTELADFENVVAVVTWGNNGDDIRRLVETLKKLLRDETGCGTEDIPRESAEEIGRIRENNGKVPKNNGKITEADREITETNSLYGFFDSYSDGRRVNYLRHAASVLPQVVMTPREAFYSEKILVKWEDAVGRVAGESIVPYPPGIPLICPGEVITREIFDIVQQYRKNRLPIHGPADRNLETMRVIRYRTEPDFT